MASGPSQRTIGCGSENTQTAAGPKSRPWLGLATRGEKPIDESRPLVVNWIVFCYQIKLYRETATLFRPIGPDLVDKALYEHVRKIAQACEIRLK